MILVTKDSQAIGDMLVSPLSDSSGTFVARNQYRYQAERQIAR